MSRWRWPVVVLVLLAAYALRMCRLADLGTQADEGVHIAVAERLAAGDVLYRDLVENRTPGVEWLLGAAFWLGAGSVLLGRLLSVGAAMLTMAALFAAGSQAGRPSGGLVAMLLFSLAPLPLFWSRFTMLEHFQTAAAALSVMCAMRALTGGKVSWWLAAGLLAGFGFLAKQSALTLLVAYAVFLALDYFGPARRQALPALALTAGFVAALIPLALVIGVQRAGPSFAHLVFGVQRLEPTAGWPGKGLTLLEYASGQPIVPLAVLSGYMALRSTRPMLRLALLWTVVEWGALLLPPELDLSWGGYSHYVIPAVAAASLLAGAGLWQASGLRFGRLPIGLAAVAVAATLPGWVPDLTEAVFRSDYPLAGFEQEMAIGEAAALITPDEEPILVVANSIFYHWADRRPASRYFHYPAFLASSSLAAESQAALVEALSSADTGAVLLSRFHLYERLPATVVEALWDGWTPVAMFPYPYQQDIFLFVPCPEAAAGADPLAEFGDGIELVAVRPKYLAPGALLLCLEWSATSRPTEDFSVFAHLLGPEGVLVSQHDGVPGVGFRPTSTWGEDELVTDCHWLPTPDGLLGGHYQLRVGLYRPATGQRLLLQGESAEDSADAWEIGIEP
jgi:hypothetical protein